MTFSLPARKRFIVPIMSDPLFDHYLDISGT